MADETNGDDQDTQAQPTDGQRPGGDGGNGGDGCGDGGDGANASGEQPARSSEHYNGLALADLIGAPIHALVDAEAQAAKATARFVLDHGFMGETLGELGELAMARFRRSKQQPDGSTEDYDVAIPLLSMLPIPALQIKDATLEYTVKVIQTDASQEARKVLTEGLKMKDSHALDAPATIRGTFGREDRRDSRRSVDMLLKMKVNMEQADMPEGLAQLLRVTNDSTSQTLVQSPADSDEGDET